MPEQFFASTSKDGQTAWLKGDGKGNYRSETTWPAWVSTAEAEAWYKAVDSAHYAAYRAFRKGYCYE